MQLDGHGDNRGLNTSEAPNCHQTSGTIASWSMERVAPGTPVSSVPMVYLSRSGQHRLRWVVTLVVDIDGLSWI